MNRTPPHVSVPSINRNFIAFSAAPASTQAPIRICRCLHRIIAYHAGHVRGLAKPMYMTNPSVPPVNHIFVDCENVPALDLSLIGRKGFSVTVLIGARQTKLDGALVEKLLEHASSVHLVRLTSAAKNAVDFAVAYCVGRDVITDPTGHFHIISKDKGFDPLIEYLRGRHIKIRRHDDFNGLTSSASAKSQSAPPADLFTRVREHLGKNLTNRPKREAKLISHLRTFCGKTTAEEELVKLVERLRETGFLSIAENGAVTYLD